MLFMQTDAAVGTLGVCHAVVELRRELIEINAVALKHDEQVVHHVGRLIAQMVDGCIVFGRQLYGQLVGRAAAKDDVAQASTSLAASATSPASSMTFFSTSSGELVSKRYV